MTTVGPSTPTTSPSRTATRPSSTPRSRASVGHGVRDGVLGIAGDARARAVHVEVPDFAPHPAAAETRGVTVACAPDARAVESGAMLAEAIASRARTSPPPRLPRSPSPGRRGGVTVADVRVFQPPHAPRPSTRPSPKRLRRSAATSARHPSASESRASGASWTRSRPPPTTTTIRIADGSARALRSIPNARASTRRARDRVPANGPGAASDEPRRDSNRRDSNRRRTEHPAGVDAEDVAAHPELDALAGTFPDASRARAVGCVVVVLGRVTNPAPRFCSSARTRRDSSARGRDVDSVDGGVSNDATGGSWAEVARAEVEMAELEMASGFRSTARRAAASRGSVEARRHRTTRRARDSAHARPARRRRRFIGGSSATGAEGRAGVSAASARGASGECTLARAAPTRARVHQRALPRGGARGDGAEARRLTLRAAAVAAQMESAKARAAAAAVRVHNRADDGGGRARARRSPRICTVSPWTARSRRFGRCWRARRGRTRGRFEWCAERGGNSSGGRARVAPAVRGFLARAFVSSTKEGALVVPPRDAMKEPPPRE